MENVECSLKNGNCERYLVNNSKVKMYLFLNNSNSNDFNKKVCFSRYNTFAFSISFFCFCEATNFGLIVLAIAVQTGVLPEQWMVILALALSFSFVLSSGINLINDFSKIFRV